MRTEPAGAEKNLFRPVRLSCGWHIPLQLTSKEIKRKCLRYLRVQEASNRSPASSRASLQPPRTHRNIRHGFHFVTFIEEVVL
jgi:hypothetical protein